MLLFGLWQKLENCDLHHRTLVWIDLYGIFDHKRVSANKIGFEKCLD